MEEEIMRKINKSIFFLLAVVYMTAISCSKELTGTTGSSSHAGEIINFAASTISSSDIETKLKYTGDVSEGIWLMGGGKANLERIDWTAGYDMIRIYSSSAAVSL